MSLADFHAIRLRWIFTSCATSLAKRAAANFSGHYDNLRAAVGIYRYDHAYPHIR
jgi:hypothetical protein